MKCPDRFNIVQHNIRKPILNRDDIAIGEYHLLLKIKDLLIAIKKNVQHGTETIIVAKDK